MEEAENLEEVSWSVALRSTAIPLKTVESWRFENEDTRGLNLHRKKY